MDANHLLLKGFMNTGTKDNHTSGSTTERIPEAQAVDQVYEIEKSYAKKVTLITLLAFVVAILFNFPLEKNIITLVEGQLAKNRRCPLAYQKLEMGYFLPKLIFSDLTVPGQCFNKAGTNINFDEALVKLSFPSFWPVGIKTKIEARAQGARINVFPRIAIGGHAIQIEDTYLEGPFLSKFTPFPNLFRGKVKVQGNFELKGNKVTDGHLRLDSDDFVIPAQTISGINLSSLPLKKLEFAGTYTKKTFHLKAMRLGTSASPIQGEFTGKITPNMRNMNFSRLDLEGKVRFSDAFLNEISLLRIMLNGKKQKGGFYYIRLTGTLAVPKPTFIDPP
jgi:type II secretion system protein N